jgi:hypothetical protein
MKESKVGQVVQISLGIEKSKLISKGFNFVHAKIVFYVINIHFTLTSEISGEYRQA